MARNEAKIKFVADTKEFTEQIKQANSSMSALNAGLKLNEAEFKNTGNSTDFLKNKQQLLIAELDANRTKQEALNGKIEAAKQIYGENSDEVQSWTTKLTKAKTEEQNLQYAISECDAELERNEQELHEVDNAVDEAGSSAEQSTKGWTMLKSVISDLVSNAIQEGIQKLKEFAKETIDTGIEFSSSMSNVQALSGATAEEMDKLEATARNLGASTIFSASDVSDAFGYMALAGWDVDDSITAVDDVLNLAAAANMDLAKASDIVTDYLTAFGLSADDAGGFVDQMAYAMANSNTDVEQLGESYKNVAATASSMGYSVEDTTAVLMTMADAGVKGGEAGTALSAIMTRLATDTKGCASTLSDYGVEVYDSQGNMNDLASILEGCRSVWNDLTQEEQANLAKSIAGTSHYSQFATIMDGLQTGADGATSSFRENTDALEDVRVASENGQSAAKEMSDIMQDNLGGDIATLSSAFQELQLSIFEGFENPLREAVQAASEAVSFLSEHKEIIAGVATIIGILTTALATQAVVQGVKAAMNAAEAASLWGLVAAQTAALAPYLLIAAAIAGIIAIIVLCVRHWDQIKSKMLEVANTIKSAITGAWMTLKNNISNIITSVKNTIFNIWNAIKTTTIGVFNGIRSTASNVWNAIKTAITTPIQIAKTVISSVFNGIRSTVSGIVGGIRSTVSGAFNAIKSAMTSPIQSAKSTISGIMNKIKGIFPLRIGKIFSGLSLPHISVSAGKAPFGIGGKGSLPHFSVSWHAQGAVFDAPTLIPTINGFHGVGEAGAEAVAPVKVLQDYIQNAVEAVVHPVDIDYKRLASELSNLNTYIVMDGREMGRAVRKMV